MKNTNEERLDFEIQLRLSDHGWDCTIAHEVMKKIHDKNSKNFRMSAAAAIFLILLGAAGFLASNQNDSMMTIVDSYFSSDYTDDYRKVWEPVYDANLTTTGFLK